MRRIGVLSIGLENDPVLAAFRDGLAKLGWIEGRNLRIDLRFGADNPDRIRASAAELVNIAPDVILSSGGVATQAVQQRTQTIPIVFVGGGDPVVGGLVQSIARPEGNITGFSAFEPSIAGKWLELLKEAAPRLTRVALLFNPELRVTGPAYTSAIKAAAPAFAVQTMEMPIRDPIEIVRALDAFAAEPNGGVLVLPATAATTAIQGAILQLTAQHRLPAIYTNRDDIAAGGLLAYAADTADMSRRAASYVDRILRGAKVIDLPVQFPTKFELVVNLKTAKAMGLTIPEVFLLRADEVIE
jgi:putative ABC transport system substrate-binding protein